MVSLKGKTAIVTGGARGLGVEMTYALAEAGANVMITYNTSATSAEQIVRDIQDKYKVQCRAYAMQVTNADQVKATVDRIYKEMTSIDIFVANAGISHLGKAETFDLDDWRTIFDVNVHGVFYGVQAAGKYMLEQGHGNVIIISSISAKIANVPQAQCAYNSSKAAVSMMTKCLASEWATRGVRVNAICPGYMKTDMLGDIFKQQPELETAWADRVPMKRLGQPQELKGAIVFLASEQSSYITGTELFVDGGYTSI
ncbi:uncharacterized protein BX664DRAFT_331254 [Halteromyces radiatus]|uniref:uncharacterized protein n=1 Tax=Halteromyces radiatus TaxID=101107 RepID=UPI00221EBE1B|nr:uncharacterized protein BX664DRAFT_331254 [Halteromyces radiatus]KAI8088736.1 hypothetical protein BX664DRAFT_331254 [Halteromyces radiatus]